MYASDTKSWGGQGDAAMERQAGMHCQREKLMTTSAFMYDGT